MQGSEFDLQLDALLVAIGEDPDPQFLSPKSGIEVTRRGTAVVREETQATGRRGVFAGGDLVTGPDTVIAAMAAGKVAAEMIDKYIRGEAVERRYEPVRPSRYVPPAPVSQQSVEPAGRPPVTLLPVAERAGSFAEVEQCLTEEQAIREASRCLRCDLQTEDAKRELIQLTHGQAGEGSDRE